MRNDTELSKTRAYASVHDALTFLATRLRARPAARICIQAASALPQSATPLLPIATLLSTNSRLKYCINTTTTRTRCPRRGERRLRPSGPSLQSSARPGRTDRRRTLSGGHLKYAC